MNFRDALPWILVLAAVLVIMAILAFAGYDSWSTLEDK
jgi:multisubunit Na+/H+ antiporter MnhC subunit